MGQYDNTRELVVSVCRTLLERGYLKATEGNVSARVPGRELLAITPSSYDYDVMQPDDICVLDYRLHQLVGTKKASIEAGMHAAVYEQRADVNAIIHTHQPYASALGLMGKPIPALFDEQVRYLGRGVRIVPYAPSGTSFLKNRVKRAIRGGDNAFLLGSHGVLVLGRDAEHAVRNMALLEKVALDYLLTLMAGQKSDVLPLPIREIVFRMLRADERKLAAQVEETAQTTVATAPPAEAADAKPPAVEATVAESRAAQTAVADVSSEALAEDVFSARQYAISEYPDVDAVYAKLDALVSRPLRRIRPVALQEYLDYFETQCVRSRRLTDEAREIIPGGVQHNLAFNHPFPLAIEKADGAFLWDVDGNRYIDFLQAGGPTVLARAEISVAWRHGPREPCR